ncbi:hypothetical protein JCM6882_004217 [Rhodosporidiobolus microsporus]
MEPAAHTQAVPNDMSVTTAQVPDANDGCFRQEEIGGGLEPTQSAQLLKEAENGEAGWARLPVETITDILTHPDHAPAQLAHNSLASRTFLHPTRRALYRSVHIHTEGDYAGVYVPHRAGRLFRTISDNAPVGACIRDITLEFVYNDGSEAAQEANQATERYDPANLLFTVIDGVPNLESLKISGLVVVSEMLDVMRPHASSLKHLGLPGFAALAAADFPNLNSMDISFFGFLETVPSLHKTLPAPPPLKHLAVRHLHHNALHLFDHYASASLPSLQSFDITCSRDIIPSLSRFPTLSTISITFEPHSAFILPDLPTSLRSLTLTRSLHPDPGETFVPLQPLPDTLFATIPATLDTLTLRNFAVTPVALLSLLENPKRLPSLKRLVLLVDEGRSLKWAAKVRDDLLALLWCWGWDGAGDLEGPDVEPIWELQPNVTSDPVVVRHDRSFTEL